MYLSLPGSGRRRVREAECEEVALESQAIKHWNKKCPSINPDDVVLTRFGEEAISYGESLSDFNEEEIKDIALKIIKSRENARKNRESNR